MAYKVAVASSDGKVVNRHFGHCIRFLIFETDNCNKSKFVEARNTCPACNTGEHSASSMLQVVTLLSDCKAVAASQIGCGAIEALNSQGIQAFIISDLIQYALEHVFETLQENEEVKLFK
ncbi:MAG TPA: NifB/NifX family molybdenum-iron cluster-binding protein [Ruminiclostridium sp.]|nr:NifB/NifX family molybdenum-iron cluster-binding protein [Ruminiclostridium sp.]